MEFQLESLKNFIARGTDKELHIKPYGFTGQNSYNSSVEMHFTHGCIFRWDGFSVRMNFPLGWIFYWNGISILIDFQSE